jgi:ParB family chromosome partitioning protein
MRSNIAENLHRSDLTKLERDEQVAQWIKITERISVQSAPKMERGRPEGGVSAAALRGSRQAIPLGQAQA